MKSIQTLFSVFFLYLLLTSCTAKKSPDQQLDTSNFQLPEEFKIELLAKEPLLEDPVDMEIDEYGRLFIVEMPGYPLNISGLGKVKTLLDTDGDGLPDQSILFADSLVMPTGIMRWQSGFLVTDPPHVYYMEDTNNDGKADKKEIILTGFALSNPQHNMNNPQYGLDNWIYLANEFYFTTTAYREAFGDEGTEIYYPAQPDSPRLPKNAADRNVRFKPGQYALEICSSSSQYGHTFDQWGHYFQTSNARPLYHEVVAAKYLQRHPDLLAAEAAQYIPAYAPAEVWPKTASPEYQLLTDVGVVTSACSPLWYLGGQFPSPYDNMVFFCEPVHNLIQTNIITPKGATFAAHHYPEGEDFLTSTDSWFRPVSCYTGPDGALYILDYRRKIIEHPEWMAKEVNESGALYDGAKEGRLYRISHRDQKSWNWMNKLDLGNAPIDSLISALEQNNIWWRNTAQRLLVNNRNQELEADHFEKIKKIVTQSLVPAAKVHALWTLEGLHQITSAIVLQSLKDEFAGVRENAIKIAELHLKEFPELEPALIHMKKDKDERVCFQLLCTLGDLKSAAAAEARQTLLMDHLSEEWFHLAALSATAGQEINIFEQAIKIAPDQQKEMAGFIKNIASLIALKPETKGMQSLISTIHSTSSKDAAWWQAATLEGLSSGWRNNFRKGRISEITKENLLHLAQGKIAAIREKAIVLLSLTGLPTQTQVLNLAAQNCQKILEQQGVTDETRRDAIGLLGILAPEKYKLLLASLIHPSNAAEVQSAAIKALSMIPDTTACSLLVDKWETLTPILRDESIKACMKNEASMHFLLNQIPAGKIAATAINWPTTVNLMNNDDPGVRELAREILAHPVENQDSILLVYQSYLQGNGDWEKGKQLFSKHCSSCHQMGGQDGFALGPDLSSVRNRSKEALLRDILTPSASIADGYELWSIVTHSEENLSGVIISETPTSITLRFQGMEDRTISRSSIATLQPSPVSLMTPNFNLSISKVDMPDLIAYLRNVVH